MLLQILKLKQSKNLKMNICATSSSSKTQRGSIIYKALTLCAAVGLPIETKLRYVRIYFATPTFDRITKDRAAKFVDYVSAIGGTMGLLTGFSIISGVEIVYFALGIVLKLLKRNK